MNSFLLQGVLARRFLLSKTSDRFLTLTAWVSGIGVALGVAALVCVTSAINGFEAELERVITSMNGHVVIYSRAEPFSEPEEIRSKLFSVLPDLKAAAASFVAESMIVGPSGVSGAVLEGMNVEDARQVVAIPDRLIAGRFAQGPGEVSLGTALADKIGAQIGSKVKLVVPFLGDAPKPSRSNPTLDSAGDPAGDPTAGSSAPRSIELEVVGLVKIGMYEYDSKFVFLGLNVLQDFLGFQGQVTSFKLKLSDSANSAAASMRLSEVFGYPFRAKDWAQLNKNLLYAIKLEKIVIAIILAVIVIVAAFNVVSTLMILIYDKTKEIAILKAMGFKSTQSFGLFCWIGTGIGLVGVVGGVGLGLAGNWILAKTKLVQLPPDIYYIGFLPVETRWMEIFWIGAGAVLIAFAATLFPAWKVAVRRPLEGLRYD